MKKVVCLLIGFFIVSSAFAVDAKRIDELQSEMRSLIQAKQTRVQEISQIDTRLIEIQGILKEQKREDDEKLEEEKKEIKE